MRFLILFFFLKKQVPIPEVFIIQGLLALESILHLARFQLVKMVETLKKEVISSYFH